MGSKAKIAKDICPIIQKFIDYTSADTYIEPFVGGANVIDKIRCMHKVGSDVNLYLIELLKHAQNHLDFPETVTYDQYCAARTVFNQDKDNCIYDTEYEYWYIGAVGFLASFNGRFFDGGFAKEYDSGGQHRIPYQEHLRNLLSQDLSGIDFAWMGYEHYVADDYYKDCVFYCDPPYVNTKKYNSKFNFDSNEFFHSARKLSQNNIVIISEQSAPDDFVCIWEQKVKRQINAQDKFDQVERLFIHESLFDRYDIDAIIGSSPERKLF